MQSLQQMLADIQVAAPALDAAMVEMRLHVLWVGVTMLAHEVQHLLGARLHPGVPCVPGARRPARMQQRQGLARQETVVDEEGLFDRQARVAALQLAGTIVLNAVREDQILGASGRAHRVGLDKAQARNGPRQAGGLEKAARNRVAAKLLETGGFERAHASQPVEGSSTPLAGLPLQDERKAPSEDLLFQAHPALREASAKSRWSSAQSSLSNQA